MIKKIFAITLGAMLSLSCVQYPVQAVNQASESGCWNNVLSVIKPDEYENGTNEYEYICYNADSNRYHQASYYDFRYNYVLLILNDQTDWIEVYNTYCSELNFDVVVDDGVIELYDVPNETDNMINPVSIENKYESLKEMCTKMYEAGVVEFITYSSVRAYYNSNYILNALYCTFEGTEDELTGIIQKYSNNFTVKAVEGKSNIYNVEFFDVQTFTKLNDISISLKATDNITNIYNRSDSDLAVHFASSNTINLLDPYICDVDGSGKADIADATEILRAYAENAAGIQRTAANDKLDVNGDGEINIEDASYVLRYYAENAVGLR